MADTGELVFYLLLFIDQLLLVGQHLPFAAATNTKMLAKRIDP